MTTTERKTMPGEILLFHDTDVTGILLDGDSLVLRLDAYVRDGLDENDPAHSEWIEPLVLVVKKGALDRDPTDATTMLVIDGDVSISEQRYDGYLPLPPPSGPVSLRLDGIDVREAVSFVVTGASIAVLSCGERRNLVGPSKSSG